MCRAGRPLVLSAALLFNMTAVAGVVAPAAALCTWESGPAFPSGPRVGASAVNLDGTIVVLGGRPFVGQGASVHYLTPGATNWLSGPPLDSMVMQPAAGIDVFGRIIVIGGYIIADHFPYFFPHTRGYVYSFTNGVLGDIASFNYDRAFFAFATDGQGRFYVIGGLDVQRNPTSFVERYDAVTDVWTTLAPLPEPRSGATAVFDGTGRILVIGGTGVGGSPVTTVFAYDITNNEWSSLTSQPEALEGQAAVRGANGLIYVLGGSPQSGSESSSVSIYDSGSDQWRLGASLITARSATAIALDNDGFIWAMGGYSGTLGTDTVERLDTRPLDPADDCNANNIPDACDIDPSDPDGDGQVSPDIDGDGVPDECAGCVDHADCDDGVACTDDACVLGWCMFTPNDANCPDDGLFCNGAEFCDGSLDCSSTGDPCSVGFCNEATDACDECELDADCGDGVGCTDDACVLGSCVYSPNDANCPDDGLFCNGTEFCDEVLDCSSTGDPCTVGFCNEATDACDECELHADCDDGVGCTDDACVLGLCVFTANDANCPDDGLFCNGTEFCDEALDCSSAGPPCGVNFCNEVSDTCDTCKVDSDCDDGIGCTDDSCVRGSCLFRVNDANCLDDGLFCNGKEFCDAVLDCSSTGDPCQLGLCNEKSDACSGCVIDADCDDGDQCTEDACAAGTCVFKDLVDVDLNGDGILECPDGGPKVHLEQMTPFCGWGAGGGAILTLGLLSLCGPILAPTRRPQRAVKCDWMRLVRGDSDCGARPQNRH